MSTSERDPGTCTACAKPASPLCSQLGVAQKLCSEHLSAHLQLEYQARIQAGKVPLSDELGGAARRLEEFARNMRDDADAARTRPPKSSGP